MDYVSVNYRDWPPYLSMHRSLGIIICHTHGCAYAQDNIDLHLRREHNVAKITRNAILAAAKSTIHVAQCLTEVGQDLAPGPGRRRPALRAQFQPHVDAGE